MSVIAPHSSVRPSRALFAALALVLALLSGARSETAPLPEYNVKGAFLLNIAKYAEWPAQSFADASAPVVIGILGDDPFGAALDRIVRGRVINDRKIAVRRSRRIADLRGAHVVFIGASETERAAANCANLAESGALCVGDTDATAPFTAINFSIENGRIVFSVNLAAVKRSNIAISSKLLHLAKSVTGAPVGERTHR